MSRTVKVSASRRVTTPLSFIFWPLATVREPAGLVVSWARIGEAENTNRQVISTAGANILCLVNTIDLSPSTGNKVNAYLEHASSSRSSWRVLAPRLPLVKFCGCHLLDL